jgi:CO dehydrogenase/acetyl-CoA synthase beta subunit
MADGIFPVDIGPQYEGEVIRKADMRVEFGGPNVKTKFELVSIKKPEEVTHEKVEVIGPDIDAIPEESSNPVALLVDVAGPRLEKDIEPVLERRLHLYMNYIEGFYHMNQRRMDVWSRIADCRSLEPGSRKMSSMPASFRRPVRGMRDSTLLALTVTGVGLALTAAITFSTFWLVTG